MLFTEDGIMPLKVAVDPAASGGKWTMWSLHLASPSRIWSYALYIALVVTTLLFTAGIHTRWVTPVLYILTLSHIGRNSLLIYGFDRIVLVMLFWSIFLPISEHFSARTRFRVANAESYRICSLASAALLLQIFMIYLHAGFSKYGHEWMDGTAVRTALCNPLLASDLGTLIKDSYLLSAISTYGTLIVEVVAPILMILPVTTVIWRVVGSLSLFGLHAGIALTMDLAWFPYACSAVVLSPMPYEQSERFFKALYRLLPRPLRVAVDWIRSIGGHLGAWLCWITALIEVFLERLRRSLSVVLITVGLLASWIYFCAIMVGSFAFVPRWLSSETALWGLGQSWSFFAPNPRNTESPVVIKGTFSDGSVYDLTSGDKSEYNITEPISTLHTMRQLRLNHVYETIFRNQNQAGRRFSSNLCQRFKRNDVKGQPGLVKIDVYGLEQQSEKDGAVSSKKPKQIWYWNCG